MHANISQFERLQHNFGCQPDVSTFNSAIAPQLIEYDRTRQWVTLTDELITQVGQAPSVPPDLMASLLSSRNKYNLALTAGQQKINDLIQDGEQIDDFDRGVLAELTTETKADLQPFLLAGLPSATPPPVVQPVTPAPVQAPPQ